MGDLALNEDQLRRKARMETLARASLSDLENYYQDLPGSVSYGFLREPEIGLVMVRARAGGSGARFNMGELTVTRCSVQLDQGEVGHSYVKGRSKRHAELAAFLDAHFETSGNDDVFLERLNRDVAEKRKSQSVKAAATKVDFYTMVRGED
ncbi:MAG: phosphonate C-P lyase system protein PhnG [Sneathiellales bacterium]|nr:phosphonate C-P lyase system protein PhnG [Sneathiellales bacterium]